MAKMSPLMSQYRYEEFGGFGDERTRNERCGLVEAQNERLGRGVREDACRDRVASFGLERQGADG